MNNEEYLEHHGVLGQKWGVRNFQNPDGSLTDKGKARYSKTLKKIEKLSKGADRDKHYAIQDRDLAARYNSKATKYAYGGAFGLGRNESRAADAAKTSATYSRAAASRERKALRESDKASKLVNKLNKKYGSVSIYDLDGATIARGRKYGANLNNDSINKSQAARKVASENSHLNKVVSSRRYNKFREDPSSPDYYAKGKNTIDSQSKFWEAYAKSKYATNEEREAIKARQDAVDHYKKKYGNSNDLYKTLRDEGA